MKTIIAHCHTNKNDRDEIVGRLNFTNLETYANNPHTIVINYKSKHHQRIKKVLKKYKDKITVLKPGHSLDGKIRSHLRIRDSSIATTGTTETVTTGTVTTVTTSETTTGTTTGTTTQTTTGQQQIKIQTIQILIILLIRIILIILPPIIMVISHQLWQHIILIHHNTAKSLKLVLFRWEVLI